MNDVAAAAAASVVAVEEPRDVGGLDGLDDGVDDDVGGVMTTTDERMPLPKDEEEVEGPDEDASASLSSFPSLPLLFLSAQLLLFFLPIAFLSAVLRFCRVSSSMGTLTTPSLFPAPAQLSSRCGFLPLRLSPSCCSTFRSVLQPRCPIST